MSPEETSVPRSWRRLPHLVAAAALAHQVRDDRADEDRRVELERDVHAEGEGEAETPSISTMTAVAAPMP